jgi:hypothetical protein
VGIPAHLSPLKIERVFKQGTLAIYGGSRVRDDLASQVKAPLLGACGNDPVDSLINPSQVSLDGLLFGIGRSGMLRLSL